jgi:hypothetical protein
MFPKYYFALNSMQACLQKNDLQNVISIKGCIYKTMFENEFQNIIYKIYSLIFKGLF